MSAMDQKTRRYLSIAASIAIHSLLLFIIARFTMDLTSPEGTVTDGTVEMEVMPQGSQTTTVNVSPVPQPATNPTPFNEPPPEKAAVATALPEKKTSAVSPAVAPVPMQATQEPTPVPEPETVETSDVAVAENSPTTTLEPTDTSVAPLVGAADATALATAPPATEEPAAAAPVAPTSGEGAVADQNYGVPTGAVDAKTLAAMPGNRRPEYPLMARFRRIQGRTVAQFSVSQDGAVSNTRIYSSENDAFKQPVLDAVKSWKFKGPITAGEYFWTFDFKLAGQEKEAPGRLRSK